MGEVQVLWLLLIKVSILSSTICVLSAELKLVDGDRKGRIEVFDSSLFSTMCYDDINF